MAIHIRRREFILTLGGAAAWPIAARAQQAAMPVVGFLNSGTREGFAPHLPVYLQGLSESGFVEGRNMTVVYGWGDNDNQRLSAMAAELIARRVAVITAPSIGAAVAAKSATATIPIVFYTGADPVSLGLVASINRPGGNMTGINGLGTGLGSKRMELLHELIPAATAVAFLVNGGNSTLAEPTIKDAQAAAHTLGLKLHVQDARTEDEIAAAFAKSVELGAAGLVVGADNFFTGKSRQLAALALRHGLPTVYQYHDFAAAGGLMSYGGSLSDGYRLVGLYTGRILKGEKPADLPVQQATKVELIINMKTAKAFGLTVPITLLGRADEIIE
jgi:putative ABC transport system substrate-binding protein